ncbi:carboxy terminal-processing peptidase [Gammaproteobacteria bacterium]|nr:carboxy terminal-processing peptidase [Gammaproteobacteria bacterium]
MKKLFFQLTLLVLISSVLAAEEKNLKQDIQLVTRDIEMFHNQEDVSLATEIVKILSDQHYVKTPYASIRPMTFDLFIERLDPAKNIFLESEVLSYQANLHLLDDSFKSDLAKAFKLFEIYKNRYLNRHDAQVTFLNQITEQDLLLNRKIRRDRSEAIRPRELNELKTLWKDLIINDVIQLILSGNDLDDAKEKLLKRLTNQKNFFSQTRQEDIFNIYANSLTSSYGPHTNYMSPKRKEDFEINMSLSLEGIGAMLSSDGMYTTISSLVAGGPAEKSDSIKPNDRIIGVAQDGDENITDVIGWRIDDVVKLIRGPKDSKVKLEIIPATSLDDSNTKVIEIIRNIVKLEDQAAEKNIIEIERSSKKFKIGVIELPAFYFDFEAYQNRDYNYRSSSKDVKKLLSELKKENVDGLILDLRNNGGGSLYEANALAHLFLGRGTTVQIKNSAGNIHSLGEKWGYQFFNAPLAILVNKFSASASEILAGAIQDYDRGLVIGTETFGKGTVQRVDQLTSGQLKFTESKFYRVNGSSTQNEGVTPDISLPTTINLDEVGENQLPGALEHDNIPTTRYRDFGRVNSYLDELREKNNERISQSAFYQNLNLRKEWRELQKIDWLELNLEKRRAIKDRTEKELLALENSLRFQMNIKTFSTYQEFLDREDDPDKISFDKKEIKETANILIDLIESKNKTSIASLDAG